jgi:hypothetical protein
MPTKSAMIGAKKITSSVRVPEKTDDFTFLV